MIKEHSKSKKKYSTQVKEALSQLKKLGVFDIAEAKKIGISQPTLSRLLAANQIIRLDTGLYMHFDSAVKPEEQDFIVACKKLGPDSVIGGMTALFHYGLIEQVPQRIWVVVPYHVRTSNLRYRCIRTKTNPRKGISDYGTYRITNLERTLVEVFRYASKIGLRVALRATRTAVLEKKTTLRRIHDQAKALGLEQFIERHWEAIVPEGQAA